VLAGDPAVLEAAVIGVPDDRWGEVVIAYVQPPPGRTVDPAALEALCARNLSRYKRPTSIFVVDAIAKNAVGKIDKVSLRAAHAAAPAES
jgi:long-chain acyl-CoA synthetase